MGYKHHGTTLCLTSVMTFIKGYFCSSVYEGEVHRPNFVKTLYKVLLFWNLYIFLFILLYLLMRLGILSQFATETHMFYLSCNILTCFIIIFLTGEGNVLFSLGAPAQTFA
jgi:hypothetical protein